MPVPIPVMNMGEFKRLPSVFCLSFFVFLPRATSKKINETNVLERTKNEKLFQTLFTKIEKMVVP